MLLDFTDKKVLITGGSRGIGKATALAFAKNGAQVGLNFRSNQKEAEKTLGELPGTGHQLCQADISAKENCQRLVADFVSAYGQLVI